mmetsp:Transcript_6287/g.15073  ORF Transcript_6287/g.15073 Transcript_6287/m.15073 type:complete len:215 (-) Transcript_6287:19-663(-)
MKAMGTTHGKARIENPVVIFAAASSLAPGGAPKFGSLLSSLSSSVLPVIAPPMPPITVMAPSKYPVSAWLMCSRVCTNVGVQNPTPCTRKVYAAMPRTEKMNTELVASIRSCSGSDGGGVAITPIWLFRIWDRARSTRDTVNASDTRTLTRSAMEGRSSIVERASDRRVVRGASSSPLPLVKNFPGARTHKRARGNISSASARKTNFKLFHSGS